ncbi:Beta-lactamase-like protein 2 [Phlyctochytrium bullatum]|nr:Beta-lactamase-like protein 2 [Phlyctochytrium bullatum]
MTLQGTNTYLVGTGPSRILIDAGQGVPEYGEYLAKVLKETGVTISDIILTHRHHDHVDGIPQVLSLQPSAGPVKLWKKLTDSDTQPPHAYADIPESHVFSTTGATLSVLHTPGHCDDHICLYLPEEDVLFSGDSVLGQGTTVFESLGEYLRSLQKTIDAFPDAKKIYPAHGPVLPQGVPVLRKYIGHRLEREKQIVEAMGAIAASAESVGPVTALDIVKVVYQGYPEALWPFAAHGVRQHLQKLEEEEKVISKNTVDGDEGWLLAEKVKGHL